MKTGPIERPCRLVGSGSSGRLHGDGQYGIRVSRLRALLAVLMLVIGVARADAYPSYDDGTGFGCVQCHNNANGDGFTGGPLVGLLHTRHQDKFGITRCTRTTA
jgi:hypothetical protein